MLTAIGQRAQTVDGLTVTSRIGCVLRAPNDGVPAQPDFGVANVGFQNVLLAQRPIGVVSLIEDPIDRLGFALLKVGGGDTDGGFVGKANRQLHKPFVQASITQPGYQIFILRLCAHRCSHAYYRGQARCISLRNDAVAVGKEHVFKLTLAVRVWGATQKACRMSCEYGSYFK